MNSRLVVLLVAVALWGVGIGARLYSVQVRDHEDYKRQALRQQQEVIHLEPPRGTIFDAHGRQLAVSVEVDSAFVNPTTRSREGCNRVAIPVQSAPISRPFRWSMGVHCAAVSGGAGAAEAVRTDNSVGPSMRMWRRQ